MEVDEVGDHGHQRTRAAAFADRLVGDVVEQRVDGEHDIGVVALEELGHDAPHRGSEHRADRREGRPGVARVVEGSPRGAGPADDRRVERRQPAHDGRALADEGVGHGHDAGRVEQLQRVGEGAGRGPMPAAGVAEKNEDPGRAADRGRVERKSFGYRRRAAARRAIHRML